MEDWLLLPDVKMACNKYCYSCKRPLTTILALMVKLLKSLDKGAAGIQQIVRLLSNYLHISSTLCLCCLL